jgi:acetylornithine deacetylase/succinyl-diaminopimelate desuccinylase-like protein
VTVATSLREEVTELLRALLRIDTVNPPGNETLAAEFLRDYLGAQGIPSTLVGRVPERANLVARLPGAGGGPSLAFLCHTDTVLADPAEWARDPWSGDLADGEVWGRGALDMKDQVAAGAVAFASLWREGFTPSGDLLLIATADEEVGAGFGLQWLVEAHADLVRCDYALNEGGGERVELAGSPYYLCGVAEKMSTAFVLRVRGRSGHASVPSIADNALVKAARLVEALGALRSPPALIPEVERFLALTLGEVPEAGHALERVRAELGATAAELVEPLLATTIAPTMIEASQARNVVPGLCEVTVDCRLQPGVLPADVEPGIRAALGEGDWELEWIEQEGGTRSPLDTPLWSALGDITATLEPGARLLPTCNPGFTDSHYLRQAFGTVAYGFFPLRVMDPDVVARVVHSADERIAVDDLELGVDVYRRAARALL